MGDRRAPWQSGQGSLFASASVFFLRPRLGCSASSPLPSQVSQRPCLVANENQRGSSSGTEKPHCGQALSVEYNVSLPPARTLTAPLPQRSALPNSVSSSDLASTSARINRSIVCSRLRTKRGGSSFETSLPSAYADSMPSRAAAENRSRYVPLRACTAGASRLTLARSARILASSAGTLTRRM